MTVTLSRRLTAEALGTALLVATVVGSGIMAEKLAGGRMALALLCKTIPTGAILYVLITMFGPISAHFNPAVSLVFAMRRGLPWVDLGPFVLAQVLGGIVGTLLAHAMFDQPIFQFSATARTGLSQWVSEAVATFTLVLTILGTLRARPDSVAVSVALVITAAYWFTASTSFANPAVTIARALSNTFAGIAPGDVPAFIVAQLLGALVALLTADRLFGPRPLSELQGLGREEEK
jgi:glycerol uptake facilitator-like aquaporin